jgi:hypothetical protein
VLLRIERPSFWDDSGHLRLTLSHHGYNLETRFSHISTATKNAILTPGLGFGVAGLNPMAGRTEGHPPPVLNPSPLSNFGPIYHARMARKKSQPKL